MERITAAIGQGTHAHRSGSLIAFAERGGRQPLFLVHPAGGHVLCYSGLAARVRRSVYAFQAAGLDGRGEPIDSIAGLAERYVDALVAWRPAGPVFLGGWSSGGLIAFEMALQLRRRGRSVAGVALIDCPAPHRGARGADRTLLGRFLEDLALDLPVAELLPFIDVQGDPRRQIEQVVELLKELGRDRGLDVGDLTAMYRVYLGVIRGSRRYAGAHADVDVLLVRATGGLVTEFAGHPAAATPDWGWRAFSSGAVTVRAHQGTHYTLLSGDALPATAASLEQWMTRQETLAARRAAAVARRNAA